LAPEPDARDDEVAEKRFQDPPADGKALETGSAFTPRFDAQGLVTAVVTSAADGEVLMVAHMNAEAIALSLDTGIAHFWSRSRRSLWKKGETSGNILRIRELRTDCDQDTLWLKVEIDGDGKACHTGRRSCFYRAVGSDGRLTDSGD
jgi:phosphoribosyl-AMP cyclohydrolase